MIRHKSIRTITTVHETKDGGVSVTIRDADTDLQLMRIKLDAGSKSLVTRAVDALEEYYEPDCYLQAYGMSDADAFSSTTWR